MANRGGKVEVVTDFLFVGSKITVDMMQTWNQKMFASWQESYDNLDCVLKSRDVTLPTKVHVVKAMIFPVVMYGCES